jgi:dihydrodiol dehydrogenase / D-xylose 1-dehydrogenase (NADP)
MLALDAGKNVLCEKVLTVNAKQTSKLIDLARSKNLFLIEAVWTRYFPILVYVRDIITSGRIGTVQRLFADNSMATKPDELDTGRNRMVAANLAGGALLDAGIYSLTRVFQNLWLIQPESKRQKPEVKALVTKFPSTGVDKMCTIVLNFPQRQEDGGDIHAIATKIIRITNNPLESSSDPHSESVPLNIRI